MQKRSHLLLAQSLLRREQGFPARRYELAFLFGSFQPDCNPFSYLKGSLRNKLFGGHTYGNSRRYISRRIRRLQSRRRWNLWNYYALGQLTHYVADAFTWPHNPHFPGVGWEHHVYETELRLALHSRLSADGPRPLSGVSADKRPLSDAPRPLPDVAATLPDKLETLHEQYLAEARPGLDADIAYILKASDLLIAGCRAPDAAPCPVSATSAGIGDFA